MHLPKHFRSVTFALVGMTLATSPVCAQSDHGDHDEDTEAIGVVAMTDAVIDEFAIEVRTAGTGQLEQTVRLPGEVVFNADQVVRVTPTVTGIATWVDVSVGDRVDEGQVLAVLSSRELARARSTYLAAEARIDLARETLARDQRLFEQKVGTERAVLASRQALRDAEIALQQADDALHALGESHDDVTRIAELGDGDLNRYQLIAPIGGIVTERSLTLGEVVDPTTGRSPFVVADLSTVWVNLTVYQRDLPRVRAGQSVRVEFGHGIPDATGTIAFVSPSLDESTRTAIARVVLDNPDGHWRPGLFVDGHVTTGVDSADLVVERSAVIGIDDAMVVFARTEDGFEARPVELGRRTEGHVEVLHGLEPGERYAATNVLPLKAELQSAALEHAGHAH